MRRALRRALSTSLAAGNSRTAETEANVQADHQDLATRGARRPPRACPHLRSKERVRARAPIDKQQTSFARFYSCIFCLPLTFSTGVLSFSLEVEAIAAAGDWTRWISWSSCFLASFLSCLFLSFKRLAMNLDSRWFRISVILSIAFRVFCITSLLYLSGLFLFLSSSNVVSFVRSFPLAALYALVHFTFRGLRFILKLLWHLDRQNRNTVPSFLANMTPLPG
mmetsp:Transcript_22517/g.47410  ORF Transcript_22517/g.47410 Transcript_22517/m.47410 type:complete len:223 (+) Transcript_22517:249-917(+)